MIKRTSKQSPRTVRSVTERELVAIVGGAYERVVAQCIDWGYRPVVVASGSRTP